MTLTASIDKTKSITLKTDIGFKYVFKIKDNLKALLEDILNLNITSLDYLDSNLDKITKLGKDSRLDILVKLNNEFIVNIEMQQNKCHMLPRQLFYLAKIISKELNVNDDYQKLKKYIMISIQDYQEKEDYDKEVQNSYLLVKNKQQPIDIIRFEKLNLKSKKINNPKLKGWIKLFKEEGRIEMKKYESEKEKIQKVAKLLKKLNII